MTLRNSLGVALLAAACSQVGCSMLETGPDADSLTWKKKLPQAGDYRDPTEESSDKWAYVGREARGNRPPDKLNDPLDYWLQSEQARNIERNVGVE